MSHPGSYNYRPATSLEFFQMDPSDRIVASFLSKRGYKQAEMLLRQEAKITGSTVKLDENSIANYVLFYNEDEANNPAAYEQSLYSLRKWIDDSIDIYKKELQRILFPIFVHAYLDLVAKGLQSNGLFSNTANDFFDKFHNDHHEYHATDISKLRSVIDQMHMSQNDLVQNFRNNKYGVKMSKYSFELLLCFLQDNKFMLLLRLMNQYINIEISTDKPGQSSVDHDLGTGIAGLGDNSLALFNEQPVSLGKLPPDLAFLAEVERCLDAENPETIEDLQLLKLKVQQALQTPFDPNSPARETVPFPPKKFSDIKIELDHMRDLREQVQLNSSVLPSICAYTFVNTADNLTSVGASINGKYISAGFSDSIVKLWSLTDRAGKGDDMSTCTNLIGHSGPIYAMDYSPDGEMLLTCSEDKTVRLWSTEAKSCLVAYRGHNYPVFDVSFSPLGLYFATASYDKTARLWSCDHISPLRLFVGHLSDVETVRFHPNCNYLATGSSDQTCRLWDVQRGNCVRLFAKHNAPVTALAISPDGKTMASSGSDRIIKLWDLGSGKVIKSLMGHSGTVYSLEFSKNGDMLASGGEDDCVRLWDTKRANLEAIEIAVEYNNTNQNR